MSAGDDKGTHPLKIETALVTAGRDTKAQKGFVNPPVVHGSTVLYPTADDLHAHRGEFQYGRHGKYRPRWAPICPYSGSETK